MSEFTKFAPGTDDDSGAATAEYAIATIVAVRWPSRGLWCTD